MNQEPKTVTLGQLFLELQARRARLEEAERCGWRDCISAEQENVSEFESVVWDMILKRLGDGRLLTAAAGVDMGPLPVGVSLAYSDPQAVFLDYSHGQITEGAAMATLGLDRLEFRKRWISYLQASPEVATATGNEGYVV